jgi:hypothetical protein
MTPTEHIESKSPRSIDFSENDKIDKMALKELVLAASALNVKK